jgi:hypothetical protein
MATKKANRRSRKKVTPKIPTTPEVRPGFRDPDHVQSVVLRMGRQFVSRLDELCEANARSRREIIETLVTEASLEYQGDKSARINPL